MKRFLIWCVLFFLPAFALAQWESVPLPSPYDQGYYLDVFFLPANPQYGWACGFNGYVVRTTDGGRSWSGTQLPNNAYHMESIHFVSPLIGWCSGTSPDRIYKTTDGGQTWIDVTPSNVVDIWGCYFVNASVGIVLGGGCGNGQYFYRTTDGGLTWVETTYTEPNSGLSDAILYSPTGLGYAASSGLLWRTTDGGVSWSVFASSGPKYWQEEITHVGNSFLLPVSGNTCYGDGPGGELRFSTNNGASWISFPTGANMFGTFLLTSLRGWGVGNNGAVYQTTNGGQSWQLLNCGVEGIDLDDIWFVNDTTAFIAGDHGLYRMVWPPVKHYPDSLQFDSLCVNAETRIDTIWLRNFWQKGYTTEISLTGSPAFSVLHSSPFQLVECDSLPLLVQFSPTSPGKHQAIVSIYFPEFSRTYTVSLTGYGRNQQRYSVSESTVLINPAFCGEKTVGGTFIQPIQDADSIEIKEIIPIDGDTNIIRSETFFPIKIPPGGERILFSVNPPDTGWYTAVFRIVTDDCVPDTTILVQAYGVSPIINVPIDLSFHTKCSTIDTIAIPVRNTGNDTLLISNITFADKDAQFVQGYYWSRSQQSSAAILPNESDTLFVILQLTSNPIVFSVVLENNDRTLVRGPSNPKVVHVRIEVENPEFLINPQIIDFGAVCVGDEKDSGVNLQNVSPNAFSVKVVIQSSQFQIIRTDSILFLTPGSIQPLHIRFSPVREGKVVDTVIISDLVCNAQTKLILYGEGVKSEVVATPSSINIQVPVGDTITIPITLESTGSTVATLESITIQPSRSEWKLLNGQLPQSILPGQSTTVILSVFSKTDSVFTGTICFSGKTFCPWETCIPVSIEAQAAILEYNPKKIEIPSFYCQADSYIDTIWLKNVGSAQLHIDTVILPESSTAYFLANFTYTYPLSLSPGDSVPFSLTIHPIELGRNTDTVIFKTSVGIVSVPIEYAFYQSEIHLLSTKNISLDTLFSCDNAQTFLISVENSGNLADIVHLTVPVGFGGISVDHDRHFLDSNETGTFLVTIDPRNFEEGEYEVGLLLEAEKCPWMDTVFVTFWIRDPKLEMFPNSVQMIGLRARKERQLDTAYLRNPSTIFPIEISVISVDPIPEGLSIKLPELPLLLPPQERIAIPFEYAPQQPDSSNFMLYIQYGPKCDREITLRGDLSAYEPIYELTLKVPSYEAYPGDTITVGVIAQLPGVDVDIQRMTIHLLFQSTLFTPLRVYSKKRLSLPYDYALRQGKLTVALDSVSLNDLLNLISDEDTLLFIEGLVNLATPSKTVLKLQQTELISSDSIIVFLFDGQLRLKEVCLLDARYIQFLPDFHILSAPEISDKLQFLVFADAEMRVRISLLSLNGDVVWNESIRLKKGLNQLFLDCRIPQGIYFWYFQSDGKGQYGKILYLR